ncbi:Sphingosine kinase, partial [Globisporangium splendens]
MRSTDSQSSNSSESMAVVGTECDAADDARRWRNENDAMIANSKDDDRGVSSLEEKRIGTSVSFEELLARELAKAQQTGASVQDVSPGRSGASGNGASRKPNVQKKPFLKKGERGWWMQQPDVKAKLLKHTLVSKEFNDGELSSSKATTAVTGTASMRSSTQPSAKKSSNQLLERQQSRNTTESSEAKRLAQQRKEYVQLPPSPPLPPPPRQFQHNNTRAPLSPPPPPPARSPQNDYIRSRVPQPRQTSRLSDSMRTTGSIDTLGMSGIRQSFEAQLSREANELADFEAIERELAAEKNAYLMEKKEFQREQVRHESYERKAVPSWHSSSSGSNERTSQQHADYQGHDSAFGIGNLDLDAHSSLLFAEEPSFLDDDDKYESSSRFSSDRRRISDHFATQPYAASELSAISLNDSEPWSDQASFRQDDRGVRGSLSPLPSPGSAASLLAEARHRYSRGYGSFGNDLDDRSEEKEYDNHANDLYDYEGDTIERRFSESKAPRHATCNDEPPVSALMQQIFGKNRDTAEHEDDLYDTSHDSDYYRNEMDANARKAQEEAQDNSQVTASRSETQKKQAGEPKSRIPTRSARGGSTKGRTQGISRDQAKRGASSDSRQPNSQSTGSKPRTGSVLPVVIEEKLFELEEEVKFYKAETLQMQKKKDFYEQEVKKLAKEREEFAKFQHEQNALIRKEWEKERLKMKREEKLMERQLKLKMSAATSHQDRRERGEIEALKAQIVKMQLDEKARANKWKAMNENLRLRVGELEDKNRELTEEIKFLEKDRLEQWGKYEELLKDRQRLVEPSARAQQKNAHSNLNDDRELRTVNDLFAIKDTAEELLKGWQHRSNAFGAQSEHEAKDCRAERKSGDLQSSYGGFRQESDGFNRDNFQSVKGTHRDTNSDVFSWEPADSPQRSPKHAEKGDGLSKDSTLHLPTDNLTDTKRVEREVMQPGGKRELLFSDGSKKIFFADGNEKEIEADGHTIIKFTNGDRKEASIAVLLLVILSSHLHFRFLLLLQLFPDTGISIYYYYEAQTKLTSYPDNTKVYEFPNQQIEKSYPDGTTEISFADGIKKTIRPNGDEFSVFPDGTTMLEQKDGLREVTLLNQKKIRCFPDGEMMWVAANGKETQVRSDAELKKLMESL